MAKRDVAGREVVAEVMMGSRPSVTIKITRSRDNFIRLCQLELNHAQEVFVTVSEGQPVKARTPMKELRFDASYDAPPATQVEYTENWLRLWYWVENVFPDGVFGICIIKGEPTRLLERRRTLRFDRPLPHCYDPYLGDDAESLTKIKT